APPRTLSLHDALPIFRRRRAAPPSGAHQRQDQVVGHHGRQGHGLDYDHGGGGREAADEDHGGQQALSRAQRQGQHQQVGIGLGRSEEHTSELQSRENL